jgi:hypothetical protein
MMKGTVGSSNVEPDVTMEILEEFFDLRIISEELWPPGSPD